MTKRIIAVDCDDVLVETTPFFVTTYNKLYGTNATLAQSQTVSPEIWGAAEPIVNQRWTDMTFLDGYRQLAPNPDEAIILRELARNYELHLVTARSEREREFTIEMLDRELAGVFSDMHFVGWGNSKGEVCESIGADMLIDDNAGHIEDAIHHGLARRAAILYGDYPWNWAYRMQQRHQQQQQQQNQNHQHQHQHQHQHHAVASCANWPEVKQYIDEYAQQRAW